MDIIYTISVQLTENDLHLYIFIKQVIDDLHFRNHKDADCRLRYDPAVIKQKHPQANLMCAKRFFSWLYIAVQTYTLFHVKNAPFVLFACDCQKEEFLHSKMLHIK